MVIGRLVCLASDALIAALIVSMVLSFFPLSSDSPLGNLRSILTRATDPLLRPLRRVLPTIGMFDLSGMVLIFGSQILCHALT